jgi:hypothetical protein
MIAATSVNLSLVISIVGVVVLLAGAVAVVLVYGRSEYRRNVTELQSQARSAQSDISAALQTELGLRDDAIARLQSTCDDQTREIRSLRAVVAQGTQVTELIAAVEALRRDTNTRLDALVAK